MIEALKQAVWRYADQHADPAGVVATPLDGVGMMRVHAPSGLARGLYKPLLCLVLQGAKQLETHEGAHLFTAGQSLIFTVDMPVVSRIVRASRHEPYLALAVNLDMGLLREIMSQVAIPEGPGHQESVMFGEETDEALADCALRLVRLLDRPEAVPVLRPAIAREMHYWMLSGRHGAAIRRLALPDSHAERIARAIAVLRSDFGSPLTVEHLAATAGMSPSSFHQHFKAMTSLSPLQFQKQLRLLEARRLMIGDGLSATSAAFEVGYESVSQFTREYGRMFGASPRRDAAENRAAA